MHEFVAIVTHPRIYDPPSSLEAAMAQVEVWLDSPTVVLLSEGRDYWSLFRSAIEAAGVVGPQVQDARVAALCLEAGVSELWTSDRDFSRFPGLSLRNPTVG